MINLRSDTQTLPTPEMLEAIQNAELGDDTFGEDPTVTRLEALAARMLGKPAAILTISGHMGNIASLMAHAKPGEEALLDLESHIFYYEVGAVANIAGLSPMPVAMHDGLMTPQAVKAAIRPANQHFPVSRVLCLENTHNRRGGRVTPPALHKELCDVAHNAGLVVHLDGARIFNAAIAAGVSAAEFARDCDSVMFCLSKGLSCPLGSVVVGSEAFIERARMARKRMGGGMRQAGIFAACGIVALETMVERLAGDHRTARLLAEGLAGVPGLKVVGTVESNMVYVDHAATGLTNDAFLDRLKSAGVLVSARPPHQVRLVTSRHVTEELVGEALKRIAGAC